MEHQSTTARLLILILTLFLSICYLSEANLKLDRKLKLDRSDHQAVLTIQRILGLNLVNESQTRHPCTSAGIFCERRISTSSVPLLRITRLRFYKMGLDGFLSPAIGKLIELKELSIPDNNLADRIPLEIVDCRKLEILNLKNNLFTGSVTTQLSSLTRLTTVDLSSNQLSGHLTFLTQLTNLVNVTLSDNRFTGSLPDSIWSFPNLQTVDVSRNPLLNGGEASRRSMLVEAPASDDIGGPVIASFFSFFVVLFLFCICFFVFNGYRLRLVKGKKKTGPSIFSPNVIKRRQDLAFLEQEDGLAALQIIGKGGCGEVYKAELPGSDGIVLAIKKVIQPPLDASELSEEDTKMLGKKMRQIKSEIVTVGKIRHRNLLPLLAHVPRPDCHYLVYEFMKNGSLQDMLEDVKQGRKELDWHVRFRIAVGVAHGLEYLHFGQSPMIIHRDMKPANILLDDNMEAKIGDFGLAKTVPDANTHVTSLNVAGTLGYISPEYYQTLKLSDKCDIFSFGVVLGVLVMGKTPSDEFFQDTTEMSLVRWMRNVMTSDDPHRAIDPNLLGNGFEEEMLLVLKIACFCTLEDPKQRPDSKNVRVMLAQIIKP
ncbi:unnamed protein product [Rhodiola kirilowii]